MKLFSNAQFSRRQQAELLLSLGVGVLIAGIGISIILLVIKLVYQLSAMPWSTYLLIIAGIEGIVLIAALLFLLQVMRRDIELEHSKEVFIALASHQLRTHPTAIKNFTSMLLGNYTGKLSAKQRKYLEMLNTSNESQLRIIEGLLCVAELESKQLKLLPEPVEVVALLHEVLTELQPRLTENQQHLELEIPDKLTTITDRRCLRTAMENLIANATKYTPSKGTIHIQLGQSKGHIILAVTDTGVGIADKDLPRLFVKFSRINNALSIKVAGTGLGLYIVKTIARLLHGSITVTSKYGTGSTFTLRISKTLSARWP
ncbi:MAG TPA: HAMP domain-containing sensor histidine kinase [Candidatus Saccharimonadia bacterium]